jgi:Rrf2 family protein
MKISTKGRYGIRLMLDLALNEGKGPVALKDIAARQKISEKYLWRLIDPLKAAGLVQSIRGSHGGYLLARDSARITMKAIVTVLEGPLCLVDCVEQPSACERSERCVVRDVWQEASRALAETLQATTLKDILERHRAHAEPPDSYCI